MGGRRRGAVDAGGRDAATLREVFERGQAWCDALATDHLRDVPLRIINQERNFATEAEHAAVGHGQGEDRGDRRVGRVTTVLQDGETRIDGCLPTGNDDSPLAASVPSGWHLSRSRCWVERNEHEQNSADGADTYEAMLERHESFADEDR